MRRYGAAVPRPRQRNRLAIKRILLKNSQMLRFLRKKTPEKKRRGRISSAVKKPDCVKNRNKYRFICRLQYGIRKEPYINSYCTNQNLAIILIADLRFGFIELFQKNSVQIGKMVVFRINQKIPEFVVRKRTFPLNQPMLLQQILRHR